MVLLASDYEKDTMETWGCLVSFVVGGVFFLTLKKNSPLTGVATPITIYCCDLCVTKLDVSVEEKEKQRSVSFFITLGNRCLCISFL